MQDATAGDPITGWKWTRKTSRTISRARKRRGYRVGPDTVRRLWRERRDVLRAKRKRLNTKQDPERDRPMRARVRRRRAFQKAGFPVISVEAKQRERVGNFKHPGRTYRRTALEVQESDYPRDAAGVASPDGIYDVVRNEGWVVVGTAHQTPAFAVAAIRRWWVQIGRQRYGDRKRLLSDADCGGANGNRCWWWKFGLPPLADEFDLTITVSHLPTSASKWDLIAHRLFCHVDANWAGQPLIDYEPGLKFIRTTRTETGLRVRAYLDRPDYPTGLKSTADQKAKINLKPHRARPRWNYTIAPHSAASEMEK